MRIAIDIQGIQSEGSRSRGIGRYSLEIIKNIVKYSSNTDFILVANAALRNVEVDLKEELDYENVTYLEWFSPCPLDYVSKKNNQFNLGLCLRSYAFACLNVDLILITSFLEGFADNCLIEFDKDILNVKVISIFYDLIPLLNPDFYFTGNPEFAKYYHYKLKKLKSIDALLAISSSSSQEAVRYLGFDSKKVFNVSSACDKNIFNTTGYISTPKYFKSSQIEHFFLYTGASDPRKNVRGLLEAYSQLSSELRDYKLVLAGKLMKSEVELIDIWIKSFNINSQNVILTGYVSDQDLVWLYRKCALFIFPSFHEGFGLPVLEAMSCGAPVIGSNSTSVPEIIRIKEALFDPKSIENIRELMEKAILDKDYRKSLLNNSAVQCKNFSWKKSALNAIHAFDNLITDFQRSENINSWHLVNSNRSKKLNILILKIKKNKYFRTKDKDEMFKILSSCIDKINIQLDRIFRNECKLSIIEKWQVEGPFDSSYSLSILNRCFAEALSKNIKDVSIHITEGPGDYKPDIEYLMNYPTVHSIYQKSINSSKEIEILSRNLYPPRVNDMNAQYNILHSYGWEESIFPTEWVQDFNTYLQGITVMSSLVKKILIDNGVNIPIFNSGLGLDHIDKYHADTNLNISAKTFKILHISSCFPRKGIDILLQSYLQAFTIDDDVSLIIKTFNNEHNDVEKKINKIQENNPLFPHVILLKDEFTDDQIKGLIKISNVLVAPSRGEGFGLPIGEAMRLETPVITTGWGGHMDFCNSSNCWLIDFDFVPSCSHFQLDQSYWAEPSTSHLTKLLKEVYTLLPSQLESKILKAKECIDQFTWDLVSKKNINFISENLFDEKKKFSKLGFVTTWNSRCGIASYSKNLISCMEKEVIIFTPLNETDSFLENNTIIPSWELNEEYQDFTALIDNILSRKITSILIQFNYGFFSFSKFSKLVDILAEHNINILILLHSTQDPDNDPYKKIVFLKDVLVKCQRLLVHTLDDVNRLKNIGLIDNVSLLPHGFCDIDKSKYLKNSSSSFSYRKKSIASYGFCLPNKGYKELIEAISILRKSNLDIYLTIYCAIYSSEFQWVSDELFALRDELGLEKYVTINNNYMNDEDTLSELNSYDCLIFPYQFSKESSSASVRQGLLSLRPVLVTPLNIFNDISNLVQYLPGFTPEDLANGLRNWFIKEKNNKKIFDKSQAKRKEIITARSFSKVSKRLLNIIESLELNNSN